MNANGSKAWLTCLEKYGDNPKPAVDFVTFALNQVTKPKISHADQPMP